MLNLDHEMCFRLPTIQATQKRTEPKENKENKVKEIPNKSRTSPSPLLPESHPFGPPE